MTVEAVLPEISPVISLENHSPAATMIRILIVDDQKSIRERLRYILESESDLEIVGTVNNGYDAIEQVKNIEPDVVLMDMEMPDIDGVLATRIIAQSELGEKVKVLVLSSHDSSQYVSRSIRAGAKGYLLKGASAEEIRDAVRFVYRGYTQIAPGLFEQFIPDATSHHTPLTRTSIMPSRSLPNELNGLDNSELMITGFNIQRRVPASVPATIPAANPGPLILDIEPTHIGSKSLSWLQVGALLLSGLGLAGFIYFVRQGLRQPLPTITAAEQTKQLQETPFTGKVESLQVGRINSTTPGFVQEVKVKVGQQVRIGEVLMTLRNVEAERSLQEKAQQQQQQAINQQQATSQQQQSQQQTLLQQQQQSQQRLTILEQQISSYSQTMGPLRAQIASTNLKISQGQLQNNQAELIRQKREAVQKAHSLYKQYQIQYTSKLSQYRKQQILQNEGAGSLAQAEIAKADADTAKVAMDSARSDYENAQQALLATQRNRADSQPAEARKLQLQQQLELKEQEDKVKKLQEQLQQEKLSYNQLSSTLQALRQRSTNITKPIAGSTPTSTAAAPVMVEIVSNSNGYVVELPMKSGDQVFTGTKLVGIASGQQLKIVVEVDERLASKLEVNKRASIQIKTGNEARNLIGKVANIATSVENNRRKVEVEFQAPSEYLIGQTATVYFPPQ
jgi:hemolysin D